MASTWRTQYNTEIFTEWNRCPALVPGGTYTPGNGRSGRASGRRVRRDPHPAPLPRAGEGGKAEGNFEARHEGWVIALRKMNDAGAGDGAPGGADVGAGRLAAWNGDAGAVPVSEGRPKHPPRLSVFVRAPPASGAPTLPAPGIWNRTLLA
jgi:hypothetical protein